MKKYISRKDLNYLANVESSVDSVAGIKLVKNLKLRRLSMKVRRCGV